MSDDLKQKLDDIAKKSKRKIKAQDKDQSTFWFGLGMFGMVGWSVAIPTLIFLAIGIWLDSKSETVYSWTLMLLIFGVIVGSFNAWYWVKKEGYHHDDESERR